MSRARADRSTQVVAAAPWIVVLLGVTVMIVLLVVAFVAVRGDRRPFDGLAVSAPPTVPLPEPPVADTTGPGPSQRASRPAVAPTASPSRPSTPIPSGTRSRAATPSASPRSPQPSVLVAPAVTGRYRVVESYRNSFIGEVLVTNVSATPQEWTVRLTFPADVDRLRTFWVESASQPGLSRSGSAYVFTGVVPLAAGQRATLRVHYDRSGTVNRPTGCTTNGVNCAIS